MPLISVYVEVVLVVSKLADAGRVEVACFESEVTLCCLSLRDYLYSKHGISAFHKVSAPTYAFGL